LRIGYRWRRVPILCNVRYHISVVMREVVETHEFERTVLGLRVTFLRVLASVKSMTGSDEES
jgi:hypothetical protein